MPRSLTAFRLLEIIRHVLTCTGKYQVLYGEQLGEVDNITFKGDEL
jgi:hypothetical protein